MARSPPGWGSVKVTGLPTLAPDVLGDYGLAGDVLQVGILGGREVHGDRVARAGHARDFQARQVDRGVLFTRL